MISPIRLPKIKDFQFSKEPNNGIYKLFRILKFDIE